MHEWSWLLTIKHRDLTCTYVLADGYVVRHLTVLTLNLHCSGQ